MKKNKAIIALIAFLAAGLTGAELAYRFDISPFNILKKSSGVLWDDTRNKAWPSEFEKITLDSGQMAYLYNSSIDDAPLVISLHTWSGGFDQHDPLAEKISAMGWNYIHPHFQGPNNTPEACLSQKSIEDIDEAITYAISKTGADKQNIFIVGASGGGYAALGYYLQADPRIKKIFSWVPISDLEHWYTQTQRNNLSYSQDILACTESTNGNLNVQAARERSPLRWDIPSTKLSDLDIYAGVNDGHEGSVPVSHSLLFYNKMITHLSGGTAETVSPSLMADILTRSINNDQSETIDGRSIVYNVVYPGVSLTVFEGGHEMLVDHTAKELTRIANEPGQSLRKGAIIAED